ncbi:MAG: hypothetical protein JXB10_20710 [Pirellulales bacterium]|nr:hypothetical protein [Pirellulales bacterium]
MAEAQDIFGAAFKNGSATFLARLVGNDGAYLTPAEVAAAEYSAFLLNDRDPDERIAVLGHSAVGLTVGDVLYDTLQTDALWTVDSVGYNFKHALEVAVYPAFAVAGRRYLVEYALTPVSGPVILVRFRVNVI